MIADHANKESSQFPRCVFLTYGKPKLAQGGTTRIPGIKTTTSTKASMVQYIRLAINPMPLADNSIKLYFKRDLKNQFCSYKRSQGMKDSDIPTVYDSLLAQLARFKKKSEMRNETLIITYTGKPEKDDMVIGVGLCFLVAYTLVARDQAIIAGSGGPIQMTNICDYIRPDDLDKPQYINQLEF